MRHDNINKKEKNMKKKIRVASFIFALLMLLQVPGFAMEMESTCTEGDSSEFMDFMPSSGARSVVTTITLPVVGMSTIVRFDDSIDYQEAEYETSNPDVVVAYNRRILAQGIGTATVTITVGELCQVVNVVVGRTLTDAEREQIEETSLQSVNSESTQRQLMAQ